MNENLVIEILNACAQDLKKRFAIKRLGVFGSVARHQFSAESDVDIVVETDNRDLFELIGLKQELEGLFHRKVDLVRLNDFTNQALKRRIQREAIYVG